MPRLRAFASRDRRHLNMSSSLVPSDLLPSVGIAAIPALFFEARVHGAPDQLLISQLGLGLSAENVDVALFSKWRAGSFDGSTAIGSVFTFNVKLAKVVANFCGCIQSTRACALLLVAPCGARRRRRRR